MKKLTIAIITVFTILVSFKKDSDDNPNNTSRTLKYELTGNFTGSVVTSYTTGSSGTDNDQITLP